MIDERKNCPMRHENGNCMSIGGFCLAVNDGICEGLRNAYKAGSLADKAENNWHIGTPTTNESNVKNVFVLIYVSPDGKWSYNGNLFKADELVHRYSERVKHAKETE